MDLTPENSLQGKHSYILNVASEDSKEEARFMEKVCHGNHSLSHTVIYFVIRGSNTQVISFHTHAWNAWEE